MHQIKNITKIYETGTLKQKALDDVSFNLRDNEFVSILGHSGSGKTTLLNVIGGLDRYDSGDIVIDGISTKEYKDKDWDSYRNHSVGFVFQSYNLIPHQSVLSNVELALTISGISTKIRKEKAIKALKEVGLEDHINKQPNQLSGGQMQRVAIARALVNEPDILLADEPTGALDTTTSLQIMDLLKKVAKDRLVVMVTHNAELANEYSNRIIELQDGKVISDSNPLTINEVTDGKHENMGKSAMSFLTALSLSFNNLKSKKARTFLTAFAGSIGIIGIALILSLSTGVNNYIKKVQEETMVSYPITIDRQSFDLNGLFESQDEQDPQSFSRNNLSTPLDPKAVTSNSNSLERMSTANSSLKDNNLSSFKKYLEKTDNNIKPYVGKNGIVYSYTLNFDLFTYDEENILINTDGSSFSDEKPQLDQFQGPSGSMGTDHKKISELMPDTGKGLISPVIKENYQVVYGKWPEKYDELVLQVNESQEMNLSELYELGFLPIKEYQEILDQINKGEKPKLEEKKVDLKTITTQPFFILPSSEYYIEGDKNVFRDLKEDSKSLENLVEEKGIKIKIVGVLKPKEDAKTLVITSPLAYTRALRDYLIKYNSQSDVVVYQKENPTINVLTGLPFERDTIKEKIKDTYEYLANLSLKEQTEFMNTFQATQTIDQDPISNESANLDNQSDFAEQFERLVDNLEEEDLLSIYENAIASESFDNNMEKFGVINLDSPSSINIYADNFADKEAISSAIEDYNQTVDDEEKITYSDFTGLIMSSVTEMVNVITYVLIAFVSVSLLVSSIMIGIITYISVLERTKEIGILRAIGASKRNISTVFNAETIIIGLLSGLLGIGFTYLLHPPINQLLSNLIDSDVAMSLSLTNGLILILLSVILSFIAGLIPAKQASRKNPVEALRSE
ncbi:ABC transporter ATP-binding protein/permease [Facklamia miroungae]|uniref:Putative ABC transport system permease protein n=1 Tax=Facklamia miroungae TaxID=120956 RepID=A0A1G7UYQ0_9LACT|nr:ABC transporter ATP-binding protein/permease [Facklamia miroungae]NKZ30201.1 ABC transporter ATP-binding protein/permease [Facklamia miroungae]SDG52663.1 putative ABC transport system permease protein [Facklamia miroungae]